MRIFITGASGFVGGAIAQALQAEHEILVMARDRHSKEKLERQGFATVLCDLETVNAKMLGNCDVVIHCAAFTKEWGTESEYDQVNVKGTQALLNASSSAGVKRFIFMGTEAALFTGQDLVYINELHPYPHDSPYPYARTKAEAERMVLNENSDSFQTLLLRPRLIWGPNDQSVLPAVLEMIRQNKFVWISKGQYQTSTTHIENVVHAVSLALTRGDGGHAYFIADRGTTSLRDFLESYIRTSEIDVPSRSLPKWLVRMAARAVEVVWKLRGKKSKPPIVRFSVDMMSASVTVDTSKAERDLGYEPIISREKGFSELAIRSPFTP